MSGIQLACATDRRFLPHCATMVHSALSANPATTVHVLHSDDVSTRSQQRLSAMGEALGGSVVWHRIDLSLLGGLPELHPAPASVWFRLQMPVLLGSIERVIYLDGDAIVLESLQELWDFDLGSAPIGAATNVIQDEVHERHIRDIGVADPARYFNSGVLLLDLATLRAEGWSENAFALAQSMYAQLSWYDQDVLNLTLGERRADLHPRWNCMNSLFFFPWSVDVFGEVVHAEACEAPAVRHFEGPGENKPWHPDCVRPMHELYDVHRAATPWPRRGPGRVDGLAARLRSAGN